MVHSLEEKLEVIKMHKQGEASNELPNNLVYLKVLLVYGLSSISSMEKPVFCVFHIIVGTILKKNAKLFARLKENMYLCMLLVQSIVLLVLPYAVGDT